MTIASIDQLDGSARFSGPYEKIPPAPGTNQIAEFVEFRPLSSGKMLVSLVLAI